MNTIKLYEPQPSDPSVPAVVVEVSGERYLVSSPGGWAERAPYKGAVRKDSIASCLRGLAWSLGVPGGNHAACPNAG